MTKTETSVPSADPTTSGSGPYRVLARKYRPSTFSELIGQEAMVRTLTNAIRAGRLAHAFILTGVRGVGKTTTARIIARAFNCTGADGRGGPTADPCGMCEHCRAISEDRHVDVLEMDAASRTGVDDIRELIEGVRYRPTTARYKVYIIDEVHMLSKNAFNALLKTLEEPPEHVKFIFATTEIRKVPVTVLSRCQRFDLRRVDIETLARHFSDVAEKEGARVSEGAIRLIARAADGSVRDGLSLLDQAISHIGGTTDTLVDEVAVRAMLGLADRTLTFDLVDAVMKGDTKPALDLMAEQYQAGADPAQVLADMLELIHWLTRIKVVPSAADDPAVPEMERVRGRAMAETLSMAAITRAWQMLLKGLNETRLAPAPLPAAEMVIVRLAYAAELPTPEEALRALQTAPAPGAGESASRAALSPSPAVRTGRGAATAQPAPEPAYDEMPDDDLEPEARAMIAPDARMPGPGRADPASFQAVVELADAKREARLRAHLIHHVHLVGFEPERIEIRPDERAPADLAQQLTRFLNEHTGRRWVVTVSREAGAPTLAEQTAERIAADKVRVREHPLIQAVFDIFPEAKIESVRKVPPPPVDVGLEDED
jgi:DNA polymerase-3 subunit gamma/tau